MLILITLCLIQISHVEEQLSKIRFEIQKSCNMSVSTIFIPMLSYKAKATKATEAAGENDRLYINNQQEHVNYSENITYFQVCTSLWLQDILTVRETLSCISDYATGASDQLKPT
jgi:hypothetical protein